MEDAIKSIKAHLYDRVVSPLSGALIISWCLWNYKTLFVLFSSEGMEYKLAFVEEFYSSIFWFNSFYPSYPLSNTLVYVFVGPFITSIMYIFLYPVIAIPVYRFSLWVQKKYEVARNNHQRERLLTYDQSIELHKKIAELELQQENSHKNYLERISALNDLINEKEALLVAAESKHKDFLSNYNSSRDASIINSKLDGNFSVPDAADLIDGSADQALSSDGDVLLRPELKEVASYIIDALFQKKAGEEFFFSSLLPSETWRHYSDEERFSLERSFRQGVDSRRYINVKVSEKKQAGVIPKYTVLDFQDYKDSRLILIYILEKMSASRQKTAQLNELKSWREWNFYALKNGVDYLQEKGFVEQVIQSGRPAYRLKKEGELYLAGIQIQ